MENIIYITGFNEFKEYSEKVFSEKTNFYFTGSKDESGESWCPDCVEAFPHVEKAQSLFGTDRKLVIVDVGDRTYWKDLKNPFRTDKDTHLFQIPTLIRWKKQQRLEGSQCANDSLLEMFFTDEDED